MLSVFIVKLVLAILVCRTMSRYEIGVDRSSICSVTAPNIGKKCSIWRVGEL